MSSAVNRPKQKLAALVCAGPAAALLLLTFDSLMIRITFGAWAPPTSRVLVVTLSAGIAVGALIWAAWAAYERLRVAPSRPTTVGVFAFTFAALYDLALWLRFERVRAVVEIGAWAPATLALGVFIGGCFVFHRIGAAADRGWLGVLCAGFFFAFFLVGNREFVGEPLSTPAVVFDGLAVALTILLLLLLRSRRPQDRPRDQAALITITTLYFLFISSAAMALLQVHGARSRIVEVDAASPPADAPHIVLIVFDTMRGDVFDDVLSMSPEGQAFAEALGPITWFDQAVAVSSWTGPSMSTILTGLHPLEHQVRGSWNRRIPKDEPILAEFLRSFGYQTLGLVANRSLLRSVGTERGFQIYEGLDTAEQLAALGRPGFRFPGSDNGYGRPEAWFVDARRARKVLDHRLGLIDPERPVFLWYHLMDVHQPLRDHSVLEALPGDEQRTPDQLRYRNSARFALGETARAVQSIQSRLGPERTLTLVLSDHGEMLASDNQAAPGDGSEELRTTRHGHAYFDTLVRVPLGLQLPERDLNGPPRKRSQRLVSHLDVVPTVLDSIDLNWPRPLQGCSLVPLSAASTGPEPEHCHPFVVSDGNLRATAHASLRTTRLKLMASPDDVFDPLLFDLALDPHEQTNRAKEETEATASALALLRLYWKEFESERPAAAGHLDPDQIENLRALGYLD